MKASFKTESEDPQVRTEKIRKEYEDLLEEDLFIVGRIEEEDGSLTFNDFDRLFRIIQKHATLRLCDELETDAKKRVDLLRNEGLVAAHNKQYRDLCIKSKEKEEQQYEELTQYICERVGVDWDAFESFMIDGLPNYTNEYLMSKSEIEEKREKWIEEHHKKSMSRNDKMKELTKEETMKIFKKQ